MCLNPIHTPVVSDKPLDFSVKLSHLQNGGTPLHFHLCKMGVSPAPASQYRCEDYMS